MHGFQWHWKSVIIICKLLIGLFSITLHGRILKCIRVVFALIGSFINWFPLIVGLTINPKWLKVQFLIIFVGVNLTFFPIHFLGLSGIPRRYSDYPDSFIFWNVISRIGSIISVISVIFFLFILFK